MPTTQTTRPLSTLRDKNLETRQLILRGLNAGRAISEKRERGEPIPEREALYVDYLMRQVEICPDLEHEEAYGWVADIEAVSGIRVGSVRPTLHA
jgi:hypothetical protein